MTGEAWPIGSFLVIVAVVAGLALVVRWAFGSGYGRDRERSPVRPSDELLVPIATVSSAATGHALRAVLSDAGIRSTLRTPAAHRTDVLVFPDDADRARTLAASFGQAPP